MSKPCPASTTVKSFSGPSVIEATCQPVIGSSSDVPPGSRAKKSTRAPCGWDADCGVPKRPLVRPERADAPGEDAPPGEEGDEEEKPMYSPPIRTTPGPAKGGLDEIEITSDDDVSVEARVEFSAFEPSYMLSCTPPPTPSLGTPLREEPT